MYDEIIKSAHILIYMLYLNGLLVAFYLLCGISDFFLALFKPGWISPFGLKSRKRKDKDEY